VEDENVQKKGEISNKNTTTVLKLSKSLLLIMVVVVKKALRKNKTANE